MAIAKPTAAIARLRQANGNAYDASTNPGGLAEGGHRPNFVPNLNAVTDVGLWTESVAADVEAAAVGIDAKVQRAEDAAGSAEADADRAAAAAIEASKFDPATVYRTSYALNLHIGS